MVADKINPTAQQRGHRNAEAAALCDEMAALRHEHAFFRAANAELEARVFELQLELSRRKKGFLPKSIKSTRQKATNDRRASSEPKSPA